MRSDVLLFSNLLLKNNLDVIKRHKKYEKQLTFLSNNRSKLRISKNIASICERHSLIFRCDCYGAISIPDPFHSFFESFIIRSFKLKNAKLQIQCHGDFGESGWQKLNLKNYLFSKLASRTLKKANQIRCVGKTQADKIIFSYKIDPMKIIIAPISTKDRAVLPLWNKPSVPVVVFLGRLHKERCVNVWAQTAQKIFTFRNDVNFLIIGDGPERANFEKELFGIPKNQLSFVGKLLNEEALELLSRSSVLFSTAPFESFGMAMVEAAKIGLPIVSRPTSGALDLREGYDSISLGDTVKELAELVLVALKKESPGIILGPVFLQSESEAVDAIVEAWMELL